MNDVEAALKWVWVSVNKKLENAFVMLFSPVLFSCSILCILFIQYTRDSTIVLWCAVCTACTSTVRVSERESEWEERGSVVLFLISNDGAMEKKDSPTLTTVPNLTFLHCLTIYLYLLSSSITSDALILLLCLIVLFSFFKTIWSFFRFLFLL